MSVVDILKSYELLGVVKKRRLAEWQIRPLWPNIELLSISTDGDGLYCYTGFSISVGKFLCQI